MSSFPATVAAVLTEQQTAFLSDLQPRLLQRVLESPEQRARRNWRQCIADIQARQKHDIFFPEEIFYYSNRIFRPTRWSWLADTSHHR